MSKKYKDKADEAQMEKYKSSSSSVLGISFSDNEEQQRLLRLMQKEGLPYIFALGEAGTGKTFCALAGALDLVMMQHKYHDIIYCRAAKEVDDDGGLGYLPGELDEKFGVYCLPLMDNLRSISKLCKGINAEYILKNKIRCIPPNYVRGNSWDDCVIIIDEAQNMSYDQIQTLMTRISPNCKMIFMGSLNQIDLKDKNFETNGFKLSIDCCKENNFENDGLVGYVELTKSMRSPFCVKIDKAFTEFKKKMADKFPSKRKGR